MLGVVGLLGLTSYPFMRQPVELADSVLHTSTGLLIIGGWWVMQELDTIRAFVGGMGLLLMLSKIVIVGGVLMSWAFLASITLASSV